MVKQHFTSLKKPPLTKEHRRKTKPRSPLLKSSLKRYLEFLKRIMGQSLRKNANFSTIVT